MDFTQNEKYAILFILTELMKADGIVDTKEKEFLEKMYKDLGITILDLSHILDLDLVVARIIINSMPSEKKTKALSYFTTMMECDGFVDPKEVEFFKQFC